MTSDAVPELTLPPLLSADEASTYAALATHAVWWESQGTWCSMQGPKAADALNGLVTNDVATLANGDGMHAAALTPKGKTIADLIVLRVDDTNFLLGLSRHAVPAWLDLTKKYVNPRLATVADASSRLHSWAIFGARAPHEMAVLGGDESAAPLADVMATALSGWPGFRHAQWSVSGMSTRLVRAPLLGERPGFLLIAETIDAQRVHARLASTSMQRGTPNLWTVARVEGGRPEMGVDMDENTIPQEANLDQLGAISFTKGCYTGQETVARIHFRGHVNRRLCGLVSSDAMPMGAEVLDGSDKVVGDVRSSVRSPRLGPIAMAMIRREVAVGDPVRVRSDLGVQSATVAALPFPTD